MKFPAFHGTQRFITSLTRARHLSLSWASSTHSITLHPTSWRNILILFFQLSPSLPSGPFPSRFPTKTLYTPLSSPTYSTCPAHHFLLDFFHPKVIGAQYRSISHSICNFLHYPIILVPLSSKYFPQHPIFNYFQPTFVPQFEGPSEEGSKWLFCVSLFFSIENRKTRVSNFNLLFICIWIGTAQSLLIQSWWRSEEIRMWGAFRMTLWAQD